MKNRNWTAMALSALLIFGFMGCSSKEEEARLANPWQEVENMEAALNKVDFKAYFPKDIPDYPEQTYMVDTQEDAQIIEVIYSGNNGKITLRIGKGDEDISGNYNQYAVQEEKTIGKQKVTLKGDTLDDGYNLATWQIKDLSYSIDSTSPIAMDLVTRLVQEMSPAEK